MRAIHLVREYSSAYPSQFGKHLILNNFNASDSPFLFVSTVSSRDDVMFGTGFYVTDFNSHFVCAGCCINHADSVLEAEAVTLVTALGSLFASDIQIKSIFIASSNLYNIILDRQSSQVWRLNPLVNNISDYFLELGQPTIHLIPDSWLAAAASLALLGVKYHDLTLFHHGKELPYWIMKQFTRSGIIL